MAVRMTKTPLKSRGKLVQHHVASAAVASEGAAQSGRARSGHRHDNP
jgi:hypothetical protein